MYVDQGFVRIVQIVLLSGFLAASGFLYSASGEKPVSRTYAFTEPAPSSQSESDVLRKSEGCVSCHTESDSKTMHRNPGVKLGCTDCHGGDSSIMSPAGSSTASEYATIRDKAHVLPRYPETWHYPSSANPVRTYTLLNKESNEFVRFINPSDYRVADKSCGACHSDILEASVRSLHSTGAMLWGGASYNNGILPYKNYILGESYTNDGQPGLLTGPLLPEELLPEAQSSGVLSQLYPLPAWETIQPADVFRVFERGGRNIINLFPETGIPNALGLMQRIEEPGKPDQRQSNRGPGTGARIAVPVINITKTRLNDPFTWFMGTNDQPGDYRHSGCASCHVVYANDRDERHSGSYAQYGHEGKSQSADPTIDKDEEGHPLKHEFTRAVPSSQCMICHMHQPNMFMNTYLGYTMWDYEADAPLMWPEKQQNLSEEEAHEALERNPEGAVVRGKWADLDFLKSVSELNDRTKDTRFADYHGHGWNFRAVYKRDRKGNLLDENGSIVPDDAEDKFDKAVHLSSIHTDVGMHCVDCHYSNDNHGNGYIHGEVALAVEIDCKDCHGTSSQYPTLFTSGPAALNGGIDMASLRTPDGRLRFEWINGELKQRSMLYPDKEWTVSLVKDSVTEGHEDYNRKAARAKLMSKDTSSLAYGFDAINDYGAAHSYDEMECYACHTSWTTSCGGCHLPIEANRKTERHHYEGGESRNFATYNPQVARDQVFHLGRRGPAKGGKIAPVRSSSALVLSSTNANRERIYIQQPPVSASGYSSQAFNPHFPHTTRKTETKQCEDCHLSESNDNNAIMSQLLLYGTNFIDFVGFNAWVGGEGEINAVPVTEWEEPQAVIGSYLHQYAYPDNYAAHLQQVGVLKEAYAHRSGRVDCIQLRGEYLFASEGRKGTRVYDAANIANKGFSQRFITSPVSPLGQDVRVQSADASCVVLPTTQPIHPERNEGELMRVTNQEKPFHPLYNYAFITDREEGLILVDVNTFSDGEPRNNNLERALTWNPGGVLDGAQHLVVGGYYLYIIADSGLVVVNIDQPMEPRVVSSLPLEAAHSAFLQFRYLFVTDSDGLKVVDVTNPTEPALVENNLIPIADARRVYVSRTYAYVAAGKEGVVIVDATQPEKLRRFETISEGLIDASDVIVSTTNASLFAYVADGSGGLKVVQLTSPELQPKFYGFSPEPRPKLIASYETKRPARSLSRPLERDRGVDETGGQIAVFGRLGSGPLTHEESRRLFLNADGEPWYVTNEESVQRSAEVAPSLLKD